MKLCKCDGCGKVVSDPTPLGAILGGVGSEENFGWTTLRTTTVAKAPENMPFNVVPTEAHLDLCGDCIRKALAAVGCEKKICFEVPEPPALPQGFPQHTVASKPDVS